MIAVVIPLPTLTVTSDTASLAAPAYPKETPSNTMSEPVSPAAGIPLGSLTTDGS